MNNKKIPRPDECIELLKKAGCNESVIKHCKTVRDLAVKIAEKTDADIKLVEAGALLHDIGRSKTHGIRHAIEGVKIAQEIGLPDSIIKIIERHIGAGIPKKEAIKLGLPEKNYIPRTLEEKIVCHADNLIDNNHIKKIEYEIKRAKKDGNMDYAKRLRKLHDELSSLYGMDLNRIKINFSLQKK